MGSVFLLFVTVINSFAASAILTRVTIDYLIRKSFLDNPNARSSHDRPIPRGAGLAIIPLIVCGMVMNMVLHDEAIAYQYSYIAVCICITLLCFVSWLDDLREKGLPAWVRLLVQGLAVALPLWSLDADTLIFHGFLPLWLDRAIAAVAWLWFINLFNFMDGINGISGVQTVSITLGIMVLYVGAKMGNDYSALTCSLVMGAALGFLVWNWGRAKIFLGDVGSIGLGYLCGFLLILTAADGALWAALILPLYYVMDTTVTLIKRIVKREKIWEAHRKHYYQAATVTGALSHSQTSLAIAGVNIVLIILAVYSTTAGAWVLLPAVIIVYGLMRYFKQCKCKAAKK